MAANGVSRRKTRLKLPYFEMGIIKVSLHLDLSDSALAPFDVCGKLLQALILESRGMCC
jgi:hypothetical protein